MNKASLIIPTYNRVYFIDRILRKLTLQNNKNLKEIIIVDSDSLDGTSELIKKYQDDGLLNIIKLDTQNNISRKRNSGIKEASSECLIFIDDDCVPNDGFIDAHINSCNKHGKVIHCGSVYFDGYLVDSSNYIRYRNSRHIPYLLDNIKMDYRSIVTMNMSVNKSELISNNLFFDEEFLGYGMEDNEFGFRATKCDFTIVSNTASILHLENKTALEYASKIFHTSRNGVKRFKDIHPEAVNGLRLSFFFERDYKHRNFMMSVLIKLFRLLFEIKIARLMLLVLVKLDGVKVLYFRPLYQYIYACYYSYGVKERSNAFKDISEIELDWYKMKGK